jgi:hypothetical protein
VNQQKRLEKRRTTSTAKFTNAPIRESGQPAAQRRINYDRQGKPPGPPQDHTETRNGKSDCRDEPEHTYGSDSSRPDVDGSEQGRATRHFFESGCSPRYDETHQVCEPVDEQKKCEGNTPYHGFLGLKALFAAVLLVGG